MMLALLFLSACAGKTTASGPRIVTIGAGITEIVYALGVGDQVVGADITSVWPDAALSLPRVGLPNQIGAEGVLSVEPTLLIGDGRAGPVAVLDQLRASDVEVATFSDPNDSASAAARIRAIGALVKKDAEAERLATTLLHELAEGEAIAKAGTHQPRVMFLYARGHRTLLVAGAGSPVDALLRMANADNVMREGVQGFQPVSAEAIVAAAPDIVIVTTRGLESLGGIEGVLQVPGVAQTPAGQHKRVIAVDDLELLGFGPRLGVGLKKLATALHKS